MKRSLFLFLCLLLLLLACSASAEVSSNLFAKRTYNGYGKVAEMRYVDAEGNTVMADNLGYAIARYKYNTFRQQTQVAYFDADGNPVNCAEGYHQANTKKIGRASCRERV